MNLNEFNQILEGGAAMQASRISVKDIKSTFDRYVKQVIKRIDPSAKYKTIGSLGKKDSSGDIDVAISTELDLQDVSDKLTKLGVQHKVNKGLKQIYTEYPIYDRQGNDTGDIVQVDLMFGDVDFLSNTYWAPGESHSEYTGSDLSVIFAAFTRFTPVDKIKDQENRLALDELKNQHGAVELSYVYDINRGVFIKARWEEELKSGKNKGSMKTKSSRLPSPVATSVGEIIDLWNTDSKVNWERQDFEKPLEKVWEKAKQAFSSKKIDNIKDYTNNSIEKSGREKLENFNRDFSLLLKEMKL